MAKTWGKSKIGFLSLSNLNSVTDPLLWHRNGFYLDASYSSTEHVKTLSRDRMTCNVLTALLPKAMVTRQSYHSDPAPTTDTHHLRLLQTRILRFLLSLSFQHQFPSLMPSAPS